MTLQEVLRYFDGVKRCNDSQYMARCPCHDDRKQSLSIGAGEKGVVLKCQAGCDTRDIIARVGLKPRDLFYEQDKPSERPRVVATYQYPGGVQKLRRSDKSFTWRRPDGKGGWIYNRQGVPHSLYIAGELAEVVAVVEGEKDADNLHSVGFDAVSGEDGAGPGKWRKEYTEQLKGLSVVIFSDNDNVGKAYAQETAAALHGVAKEVRLLDLSHVWPEIPEHGDVSDMLSHFGTDKACELMAQLMTSTPVWEPGAEMADQFRNAKAASEFGEDNTKFLWYPYLPIGDYTVMMADGGTGKTILCCGIVASISNGKPLPGVEFESAGRPSLIISGEDSGEVLKKRLDKSEADLDKVFILDRIGSEGMSISERYEEFEATVGHYKPALVVLDPWHCFLGEHVDISRVNSLRPILQRISNLCKKCDCAMILISHINKRAQGENVNNAATGSTDLINAARSAFRVVFDETDEECRIMVHTKSNYAPYGQSVRYRIMDGGVKWEGFSEITRQTLEMAARRKATPWEVMQRTAERETINHALIKALEASANQFIPTRFSYEEFKKEHGELIFGGLQPKRALDGVKDRLDDDGFFLKPCAVKKNGKMANGFMIQRIDTNTPDQVGL